ncbi:MAG TPA: YncE family protein [Steroidobacteraceae bacterium]|nr:YncE family protein [Steroidobacteraceae bacterium]
MRIVCKTVLLISCAFASASNAQQAAPEPKRVALTDPVLIVLASKEATARIFSPEGDRLPILATLPTGQNPQDVAIARDGRLAYVTNAGDDSLTVLDLEQMAVRDTLRPSGLKSPTGIAVGADGKKLFVGSRGTNSLLVLGASGEKVSELPVQLPTSVAMSPDGKRLYVTSDSTQSVLAIDASSDKLVATIKTGRQPRGLAFSSDGKTLVITCVAQDIMHVVNTATNEIQATLGAGRAPIGAAVAPSGLFAYNTTRELQAGTVSSYISVIDLRHGNDKARKGHDIPIGTMASKVLVSDDGQFLYIAAMNPTTPSNTVIAVDLAMMELARWVDGGAGVSGMALRRGRAK